MTDDQNTYSAPGLGMFIFNPKDPEVHEILDFAMRRGEGHTDALLRLLGAATMGSMALGMGEKDLLELTRSFREALVAAAGEPEPGVQLKEAKLGNLSDLDE